jgi:hypothetical protein
MLLLARLLIIGIALFLFLIYVLQNFDTNDNVILNKIYIFAFIFFIQIITNLISNLFSTNKIPLDEIINLSINNALLGVIAYDIFGDLERNGNYTTFSKEHKALILVFLIIAFITSIRLIQMLFENVNI